MLLGAQVSPEYVVRSFELEEAVYVFGFEVDLGLEVGAEFFFVLRVESKAEELIDEPEDEVDTLNEEIGVLGFSRVVFFVVVFEEVLRGFKSFAEVNSCDIAR